MMASKELNKLLLLQQHVSDLKDQKNEVDRKKSELLQKKNFDISDVSDKCMSLTKSIDELRTSANRQLNEFYEGQERLFDEALANLATRIARAEEKLIIDLNGIPVPEVKVMSFEFDVTRAKTSIDQLQLRPLTTVLFASGATKGSTNQGQEPPLSMKSGSVAMGNQQRKNILKGTVQEQIGATHYLKRQKLPNAPTPKKPRVSEGRKREHVRDYIHCNNCHKPRCIYRDHFLTDEEKMALSELKKVSTSYECGGQLPTKKHSIVKTLVVEDEVNCGSVVSWHYFHPKLRNPPVCYLCGSSSISPVSEEEKLEYRALHKICTSCQKSGGKQRSMRKTRVEDSDDGSMDDSDDTNNGL